MTDAAGQIRAELARAARALGVEDAEPIITRPSDPAFGDWATNLAMMLARPLKQKPRDVAEKLIAAMDKAIEQGRNPTNGDCFSFRVAPSGYAPGTAPPSSP